MIARLYFMHQVGCPACEEAKPDLAEFERRNPNIQVVRVDIANLTYTIGGYTRPMEWTAKTWSPRVTPTYVLAVKGERLRALEGGHSADDLERWIFR